MRVLQMFLWCGLITLTAGLAGAAPGDAVLDPKAADADFPHQGEYLGDLTIDNVAVRVGAQVVAKGDGKFTASGFMGGLPGAGWDGTPRRDSEGAFRDGAVRFDSDTVRARIQNGSITVEDVNGNQLGMLQRTERASPTLGAKPPAGAAVLFDGSGVEQFPGARMSDDKLLIQGATSKAKFRDCTLHLEFMLSYMPKANGQGRANSGCYLQGRYEVQILDSFGLEGQNNECGGIYGVKAPDVNMCLPPLQWQTYDVEFTAAKYDASGAKTADARMTVKHNGVTIHRDAAIPKITTAAPVQESPEPGPLYLQDHGNPIRFRNIWIVEK